MSKQNLLRAALFLPFALIILLLLFFGVAARNEVFAADGCTADNVGTTCYINGDNWCCGVGYCNIVYEGVCDATFYPPDIWFYRCRASEPIDDRRGHDPCVWACGCRPPPRCSNPDGAEGDWRYDCTTNNCSPDVPDACVGRPQQCRSGTWVTTNEAGECTSECTGCSHSTPPPPTPPPPTPPPGGSCDNSCGTCGYRLAGGSCSTDNACCHRVCSGSSCITIYGSGSNACDNDAQCSGPTPTPSPTPPASCSSSVTMNASPNPVIKPNTITFSYGGDSQSSLCVYDTLTGGVEVGVPDARPCDQFDIEYPMSRTCVTTTAGSYNWTHYWWYNASCPLVPNRCRKTIPYTIATPAPTIGPWIQVTGDVHSNVRIYAPGGP